jgi:acyl carrier protein
MKRDEIEAIVRQSLDRIAPGMNAARVDSAADLWEELDLDSMDFTTFMVALPERLGVDVPEVDYPKCATIDGAVNELAGIRDQATMFCGFPAWPFIPNGPFGRAPPPCVVSPHQWR